MILKYSHPCNPELGDLSAKIESPVFVQEQELTHLSVQPSPVRTLTKTQLFYKLESQAWPEANLVEFPGASVDSNWFAPTSGTYDRRLVLTYFDDLGDTTETIEDKFYSSPQGSVPGTVELVYDISGDIAAMVRYNSALGRGPYPAMTIAYQPDPDSATPGADSGTMEGDDFIFITRDYDLAPGSYLGTGTVTHADGSTATGPQFKFTINHFEVWYGTQRIVRDGVAIARGNHLASAWADLTFAANAKSPIQALTIADSSSPISLVGPILGTTDWSVRTYSPAAGEVRETIATLTFATHTEEFRYFVEALDLPVGKPLIEGVTPNSVIDNGDVASITGAPTDPARALVSVALRAVEYDDHSALNVIKELSSTSYSAADYQAYAVGVGKVTHQFYGFGFFGLEQINSYSDGTEAIRTLFSNPEPTPAPAKTSFFIGTTALYIDGALNVSLYVDHQNTVTAQELIVNGVAHPMDVGQVGGHTRVINLASVGMATAGTYTLSWRVTFADTVPTVDESSSTGVTVQNIPVATLLDTAKATPSDDAGWQAILSSPDATTQQKAIAQSAIDFNAEISAVEAANPGDPILVDMRNDRQIWVDEGAAQPYGQWFDNQGDWDSPQEVAQARAWVTEAPTSSVNALLSHLNQPVAWESGEYFLQAGSVFVIRDIQASGISDAAILVTYRGYQSEIAKGPGIFKFWDYLNGARN